MKKQSQKIFYCKWGLANVYSNRIEINNNLKYNKQLRDYIVKHELGHNINSFDLYHEFNINYSIMPKLILFIITNPKTWIDFSPIQIKNKIIIYDINMFLLYLILFSIILFIRWL